MSLVLDLERTVTEARVRRFVTSAGAPSAS